jgi:catalase
MRQPSFNIATDRLVADPGIRPAASGGTDVPPHFHLLQDPRPSQGGCAVHRTASAQGCVAYGAFTVTHDIRRHTTARLFRQLGRQTGAFVRFTSPAGGEGATPRAPCGFDIRFHTEDGRWDLAAHNIAASFMRDPLRLRDFLRGGRPGSPAGLAAVERTWDFWSRTPQALHHLTMLFSDRGMPWSYRHMDGFGRHAYSLLNAAGERVWVKWHLKSQQGIRNLTARQAGHLAVAEPDHARRDLFEAIARGDYPRWNVFVQVMTEPDRMQWQQRTGWDAFDATKVWPHGDFPCMPVGVLELHGNPDEYEADGAQLDFSPAHVVPGMGHSPDRMLQARLLAEHGALPSRFDGDPHDAAAWPGGPCAHDDHTQAGRLFRLLDEDEQDRLTTHLAHALAAVRLPGTHARLIGHLVQADRRYGAAVARKVAQRLAWA